MAQGIGYRPPRWLRGRHLQTIGGLALRSARRRRTLEGMRFRRERLTLPDGDFVDLDFADPPEAPWTALGERAPVVLLLHGLEGSARSDYAHHTYRCLASLGVCAVGFNFRSCSGELNRGARLYHSGETDDLRAVLRYLRPRLAGRPLGAIGFSLGGNVLLKYLGESGQETPIQAAAAVSVPYDLAACAEAVSAGASRIYTRYLLRKLQRKLHAKARQLRGLADVGRGLAARTFFDFDDAVTAPIFGFDGAVDYYERCSSMRFLDRIRRPSLLIQALDDPFLPSRFDPHRMPLANPCLTPEFSRHGGHVGFVSGRPWALDLWAERRAARFLAGCLQRGSSSASDTS